MEGVSGHGSPDVTENRVTNDLLKTWMEGSTVSNAGREISEVLKEKQDEKCAGRLMAGEKKELKGDEVRSIIGGSEHTRIQASEFATCDRFGQGLGPIGATEGR